MITWVELIQCRSREKHYYLVNLNTRNLEKATGCKNSELKSLLRLLEKLGVILINSRYSAGRFPRSYGFTKSYRRQKPVPVTEKVSFTARQLLHHARGLQNKVKGIEDAAGLNAWLYGNLSGLRLDPSIDAYMEQPDWEKKEEASKNYAIMVRNALDAETKEIGEKTFVPGWCFSRENSVGRLYTPITSFHRELRPFLRFAGQPLMELDQHASQPFLLLCLYQEVFDAPVAAVKAEADKFYSLWGDLETGNFYENFVRLSGAAVSADQMKKTIIKGVLNCKSAWHVPKKVSRAVAREVEKVFLNHFPILDGQIKRIKTVRDGKLDGFKKGFKKVTEPHCQFAVKMQQIESSIFIDGVARELMQRGIFCYTVHDAIGCLKEHVPTVQGVIERHVEAKVRYKPAVRTATKSFPNSPVAA